MRINYFKSGSVNFYNPTSVFCTLAPIWTGLHHLSVTVCVSYHQISETILLSDKCNDGADNYMSVKLKLNKVDMI